MVLKGEIRIGGTLLGGPVGGATAAGVTHLLTSGKAPIATVAAYLADGYAGGKGYSALKKAVQGKDYHKK